MGAMERRVRVSAAAVGAAVLLAACGGGDSGGGEEGGPLTVWTLENLPDRLAAQQEIAAAFTESSGIEVDLVGIDEDPAATLEMVLDFRTGPHREPVEEVA